MNRLQEMRCDTLRRLSIAALLAGLLVAFGAADARQGGSPGVAIVALGFDSSTQTLLKADAAAFYRSGDGGRNWTRIALPAATNGGGITTVAVAGKGKSTVYLAGPGAGLWRSGDGGRSWVARNKGLPDGKVEG